jgi:hypothetical protein
MKTFNDIKKRLAIEINQLDINAMHEKVLLYSNDAIEKFQRAVVKSAPLHLQKIFSTDYIGQPIPLNDLQFEQLHCVFVDDRRFEPLSDRNVNACNIYYYQVEHRDGSKFLTIDPKIKSGKLKILFFRTIRTLENDSSKLEYDEIFRFIVWNVKAAILQDEGFPLTEQIQAKADAELAEVIDSFGFVADATASNLMPVDALEIFEEML